MNDLTPIILKTFADALTLLLAARAAGVGASYHPAGGHAPSGYIPPSHTVWMTCAAPQALGIMQTTFGVDHAPRS